MSDTAYVAKLPKCDIHKYLKGDDNVDAEHDLRTKTGQWANVCEECRAEHAASMELGTGKGQKLVVGERPKETEAETRAKIDEALRNGNYDDVMDAVGDGDLADWL